MKKLKVTKIGKLSFVDFDDMEREALKNKVFKKEYDALELEYQVIRALIKKRIEKKLSQRKLASASKMHQSAIARLESGRSSPTLSVISRLLAELGAKVSIS
jgi:ribosome-binding protein aMBF1 (putative translation factor)